MSRNRTRFVDLCGLCTDRTRAMLLASGWEQGTNGLWQSPMNRKWYSEPVATAIILRSVDSFLHPEKGIDGFMRGRGK